MSATDPAAMAAAVAYVIDLGCAPRRRMALRAARDALRALPDLQAEHDRLAAEVARWRRHQGAPADRLPAVVSPSL